MPSSGSLALTRAVRRIDSVAAERLPTQELVERVADELRAAMPVHGLFMAATEPETLLALGADIPFDLPDSMCGTFWEYEFEVPDFNKFSELASGPRQVADLHAATGRRPGRRARLRELRTPLDARGQP